MLSPTIAYKRDARVNATVSSVAANNGKSVHRYIATLSQVFAEAAQSAVDWIDELVHLTNSSDPCAVCAASN